MEHLAKTVTKQHTNIPDMDTICRLCLAREKETINIFGDEQETNISLRIMACTSLEVHTSDTMPKQICQDCRVQLERSYYFRKRSQMSFSKLRKHIRLITAGKPSRVLDEVDDDPDNENYDELQYSLNFLMEIENDERTKRQEREKQLEEIIRQKIRDEELERLFDEAKEFFIRKGSTKNTKSASSPTEDITTAPVASTSQPSVVLHPQVDEQQTEIVIENAVQETEASDDCSSKGESQNNGNCYIVPDETYYIDEDGTTYVQETESTTFAKSQNDEADVQPIQFETEVESNEEEDENMQQDPDYDYNNEQVSLIDENSTHSNVQVFVSTQSDSDADQQNDQNYSIRYIHSDDSEAVTIPLEFEENTDQDSDMKSPNSSGTKSQQDVEMNTENTKNDEKFRSTHHFEERKKSLEELKIFKCPHCPQAFTRNTQLLRHNSVHEKMRGHQCDQCQKWFACKSALTRHIRVHTGEKPFKCEHCSKSFIQKEILKRHMVTHTGERPFQCPHCDKSFIQRQTLMSHINLNHSETPVIQMHECSLCPKAFCHASGLSRHLLTHSGVQYVCKICDKKFSDRSAVKRHTLTVHNS